MLKFKRKISLLMVLIMMVMYAPLPSAMAAMIPTDAAVGQDSVTDQRAKIQIFLARAEVIEILNARGIDPAEASDRVTSLTDTEVQLLAQKIDQLPAGGDLLGTIAAIAIIFILVLLILELTGVTDVFTFINSPRR